MKPDKGSKILMGVSDIKDSSDPTATTTVIGQIKEKEWELTIQTRINLIYQI